jgi:tetratricopeptide (TPR) repeat protein
MRRFLPLLFLVLFFSQATAQRAPKIDSIHMVLLNPYVQIAATDALNELYNFKFEESMKSMTYLKYEYGWHPLPYFMMGLNYWWRIQPNMNNYEYDDTFNAYMDTTIFVAERLYKEANPIEGAFFLAAAWGFKARLHSDRENYSRAALDGRKALKYLKESQDYTEYSPELLFGDGLVNYYAKWIRENYPMLRPLLAFFPKGDKELGLSQLRDVARNAFYARTEAQYYVMNIEFHDNENYREAMQVAEYLYTTYPDNAFFHRWYARVLYQTGRRRETEEVCLNILSRLDSGMVGYESQTGRYAAYFLGTIYRGRNELDKAASYFEKSKVYSEKSGATDKGYYFYSIFYLGEIALKQGDKKKAQVYYKQVKKLAGRKDGAWAKAKEGLKSM